VHRDVTNRFRDLTLESFVQRLSSADPVPGGGSAAAVAASLGAGLLTMVTSLSLGREKFAVHADALTAAQSVGRRLSDEFLALADDDAAAFATFAAARRLPRATDAEREARSTAIASAARTAAEVPAACVEACFELAVAVESIAGRSNPNASSDLSVAGLFAEAAARAAAANVFVNVPSVADQDWALEITNRVVQLLAAIENLVATTRETVAGGAVRDPLPPAQV
jgi:glutamate formiminotransferase/formiminotetrahydrofolate cyclodeaminase